MRFRSLAALILGLTLAACSDEPTSAPRAASPSLLLSDGSTGGSANFFFLPPVVKSPVGDPRFDAGKFNGTWTPTVVACQVSPSNLGAGCMHAASAATRFTYSGSAVTVSLADEHYQAQVDTRQAFFEADKTYRFTVFIDETIELGFVDITLYSGSAKNARTLETIAMQDGRTIPLKFRIERPSSSQAAEVVVTADGGRFPFFGTGEPGTFGLDFSQGWLAPGTKVLVTVEKLGDGTANPCSVIVPSVVQDSDCFRVETYPTLTGAQLQPGSSIQVAFCPTMSPDDPREEDQTIFKFDAPASIRNLGAEPTTLVDCNGDAPNPGQITSTNGLFRTLRWGASQVARGLGKVFGPTTAYAVDAGWGGRVSDEDVGSEEPVFSDFFWGVAMQVTPVGTVTGAPGSTVQVPVKVSGSHEGAPMAGITVSFSTASGSLSAPTAVTDAAGIATVNWTIGEGAGPHTVAASIDRYASVPSVTITAVSGPVLLTRLPLRVGSNTASLTDNLSINVRVGQSLTLYPAPLDNSGAPLAPSCTFSQPETANAFTLASTSTSMTLTGITSTGTLMQQMSFTCNGMTRILLVSVAASTFEERVDMIPLVWQGSGSFDPEASGLIRNSSYPVEASPSRSGTGGLVAVQGASCGWFQTYGVIFNPMTGTSITVTTQDLTTQPDNPVRLFVTCNGFTRELKIPIYSPSSLS